MATDSAAADWLVARRRAKLVDHLRAKGIADERVLGAIGTVPRHELMDGMEQRAYRDEAIPIGLQQTISQPFTVARMTELLAPESGDRVLEVGTGSGYQAAVLEELGVRVFSIERHAALRARTAATLKRLGYRVRTRTGDGTYGWPGYAPFAGIVVTAGGAVPDELLAQLRPPKAGRRDARMIIPVGPPERQALHRITRTGEETFETEVFDPVLFVPLVRG